MSSVVRRQRIDSPKGFGRSHAIKRADGVLAAADAEKKIVNKYKDTLLVVVLVLVDNSTCNGNEQKKKIKAYQIRFDRLSRCCR